MFMIKDTQHSVDTKFIDQALDTTDFNTGKHTLNNPTGNFFYDPWEISPEYKGTVWDWILSTLKEPHGEARIITMESKSNYVGHSDIDDRWHLNLSGIDCYLIDISNETMYKCVKDGKWYLMDTGVIHSAANFGNRYRHQLVVRKLLNKVNITETKTIRIVPLIKDLDEVRYEFDKNLSPVLNKANKQYQISNFRLENGLPVFKCGQLLSTIIKTNLGTCLGMEIE